MLIRPKLIDIYPKVITTGAVLTSYFKKFAPAYLTADSALSFDIRYLSQSGLKFASNTVKLLTSSITYVLDDDSELVVDTETVKVGVKGEINLNTDILNQMLYDIYNDKWTKIYETYQEKYGILQPYNMAVTDTEEENVSNTQNGLYTHDNTISNTGSQTNTNNLTTTDSEEEHGQKSVSAFNVSTFQPTDKDDHTNSKTVTDTGTVTRSDDLTTADNGETSVDMTYGKDRTNKRTITRAGNIGNHTNQELLIQERELWNSVFYDYLRRDLDKVLTLPIY